MGFSYTIADADNCFSAAVIYSFSPGMDATALAKQFAEIFQHENYLQQSFKKTTLVWSFPESILVPHELMKADAGTEMLNLVYGNAAGGAVRSDFIYQHNLHNIYRIPEAVANGLPSSFQYAGQTHQYSLLAQLPEKTGAHLLAVFYSHHVTLVLSKEGKLQVIRNFVYRDAEEAAFHLLNVCENFSVSPEEVAVHLNGMIDKDSNLYASLYKYFLNMEFETLPGPATCTGEIKNYPTHFFSHLFAQALCV